MSIEAVNRALAGDRLLFLDAADHRQRRAGRADDLKPIGTIAAIRQMAKVAERRHPRHRRRPDAREARSRSRGPARRCARRSSPLPEAGRANARSRRLRPAPAGADRPRAVAVERAVAGAARAGRRHRRSAAARLPAGQPARHEGGREAADPRDGRARSRSSGGRRRRSSREIALLELKGKIESAAQQEMTDAQRQYYLRQQLKAIQDELGEGEKTEAQELRKRHRRREAARSRRRRRRARGRPARADDAGLARVPDDPHLHRLGARRAVVDDDRGSPRSGGGARRCSTRTTTISTRSRSASSSTWRCRS